MKILIKKYSNVDFVTNVRHRRNWRARTIPIKSIRKRTELNHSQFIPQFFLSLFQAFLIPAEPSRVHIACLPYYIDHHVAYCFLRIWTHFPRLSLRSFKVLRFDMFQYFLWFLFRCSQWRENLFASDNLPNSSTSELQRRDCLLIYRRLSSIYLPIKVSINWNYWAGPEDEWTHFHIRWTQFCDFIFGMQSREGEINFTTRGLKSSNLTFFIDF